MTVRGKKLVVTALLDYAPIFQDNYQVATAN
jgi:hypothetical protein